MRAKEAAVALPAAIEEAEGATTFYEEARAVTWKAMDELGVNSILASDKLDGKLAQHAVIHDATPRGLAEFAQKGPENEKLIRQLLADEDLMIQMLVADGPTQGKIRRGDENLLGHTEGQSEGKRRCSAEAGLGDSPCARCADANNAA